jgi:hypothetical protein
VNKPNKSKLHSERNQQQNALGECQLTFGPESSAMQFATQKHKDKNIQNYILHLILYGSKT